MKATEFKFQGVVGHRKVVRFEFPLKRALPELENFQNALALLVVVSMLFVNVYKGLVGDNQDHSRRRDHFQSARELNRDGYFHCLVQLLRRVNRLRKVPVLLTDHDGAVKLGLQKRFLPVFGPQKLRRGGSES